MALGKLRKVIMAMGEAAAAAWQYAFGNKLSASLTAADKGKVVAAGNVVDTGEVY